VDSSFKLNLKNVFRKQVGIREQHAFHILSLSKLPIFVGSLAGLLALTFISKLQHSYSFADLSVTSFVVSNFFTAYFNTPRVDSEVDLKLLALLLILITVIWS